MGENGTRVLKKGRNKMKKIILPALSIIIASLILFAIPTEAEGAIYEDTLRLHILANSDSEDDQILKLTVRDTVLCEFSEELGNAKSKADATEQIEELLPKIKECAERVIENEGYSYSVRVRVGKEWYGTREYEGFTLPAGEYTSLIIEIGEGNGQNWWCVMYPPLCLDACLEDAAVGYTDEEIKLIKPEGFKIKFKALELFSKYFG